MAAETDGVLLAAGRSRRANAFKMTAPVGGRPLLLWGLEILRSCCGRVIVVAGAGAERVAPLIAGRPGVELVVNERHEEGMLSSVQAGAARVRGERFFVLPGDMPRVRPQTLARLLAAVAGTGIAVPAFAGRRGHPALLSAELLGELLAEPAGSSLGAFIRRRNAAVVAVDDPGVLDDLDTAEDLRRADALLGAGGKP
jgi:molybdenum cofactor cytidylyltransferase